MHTIELRAPEHLVVQADGLRLEQVLTNVLDNATKYSPDGGRIEIDVRSLSPAAVEIAVRDHGIGIADRHDELSAVRTPLDLDPIRIG